MREEMIAEAREVLGQMQAALAELRNPPAIQYSASRAAKTATPHEDLQRFLEAQQRASRLVLPEGVTIEPKDDFLERFHSLVQRLLWLLDLSENARVLVEALAKWPSDADSLAALADWCEENSRSQSGEAFRRLIPHSGDVLVLHYSPSATAGEMDRISSALYEHLLRHKQDVLVLWLPDDDTFDISSANENAMRRHGWVRAGEIDVAVREEREACAALCDKYDDDLGYEPGGAMWAAQKIRERSRGEAPP